MKRLIIICSVLLLSVAAMSFKHTGALTEVMQKMMGDMKSMKMTGDPDNDFAMMTRRHHQGAIDMAKVEIAEGKDATLKAMAKKMITGDQKDIKEFDAFLLKHKTHSQSDFAEKSMAMMDKSARHEMTLTNNLDMDFAMMMVQHHKDGIMMEQEYLKSGKEAAMIKVAKNDIAVQTKDIKELNDWMAKKGTMNHSGHSMK